MVMAGREAVRGHPCMLLPARSARISQMQSIAFIFRLGSDVPPDLGNVPLKVPPGAHGLRHTSMHSSAQRGRRP